MDTELLGLVILVLILFYFGGAWSPGKRAQRRAQSGIRHLEAGDWAEAEAEFRKAVRLVPSYAPLRRLHAVSLGKLGKWDEAEQSLSFAAELEPRNGEYLLELGMMRLARSPDSVDAALEAFEQGVARNPHLAESLRQQALPDSVTRHPRFQALIGGRGASG